jgi:hypothetical protein
MKIHLPSVASVAVCATLTCAPALAQTFVVEPGDWTLRRSATGSAAKLPASIAYTKPADGDASYAVDAATGFGFGYLRPGDSWQVQGAVGAVAEIHRNTAIAKGPVRRAGRSSTSTRSACTRCCSTARCAPNATTASKRGAPAWR